MAYKETHQRNSASNQSHYLSLYNQETLIKFPCISIKLNHIEKEHEIFGYFGKLRLFIKVHLSSLINFKDMFFHDPNMPNLQEMDISCIGRYFGILPIPSLMLYMHFQLWIYLWNKNKDVSLILRNAVEGKSHLIRVIPLHRKILIWKYSNV